MPEVLVIRCGEVAYGPARTAQKRLEEARHRGLIPDVLLLLEHPPVYTRGRRADAAELPMGVEWYRERGIEVTDTDRGGRVTYHGPGQLVAYPIFSLPDLRNRATPGREAEEVARRNAPGREAEEVARRNAPGREAEEVAHVDVPGYIRLMERTIIAALGDWGVPAQVIDGLTGVWTAGDPPPVGAARKIASIGIHVNRGITTHGLAVNVNNDLEPFEWIVPCGIEAVRMTSMREELGGEQDHDRFAATLAGRFAEVYGREPIEVDPEELAVRVDGIEALAARAHAPVGFEA